MKLNAEHQVFASLEKGKDGQYFFSKYSLSQMPNSVNLNTLSHNFPTQESECAAGLVGDKGVLCQENAHFTSSGIDGGDLLKNTLGNVIVASMTMGIGTSAYYTVSFNHEEFNKSLDLALAKINREQLVADVNRAVVTRQAKLDEAKVKFNALRSQINTQIKNAVRVQDDSQMFSAQPNVSTKVITDVNTRINKSYQWNAIEDFIAQLDLNSAKAIESSRIGTLCHPIRLFNHDIKGCEQVWQYDSSAKVEPVNYTISNAKEFTLHPLIIAEDQNVSIKSDTRGTIKMTNNTDTFITVSSLSFYMGNDIETISNLNIELAPGSVDRNLKMSRFKLYSQRNRTLKNVTKNDLEQKINLGVATKYKVIDTNLEKTIYNKNQVKYSQMNGNVS